MKKLDEIQRYLQDKREIHTQIVAAIEIAIESNATKVLLKNIKLMETVVDAFAERKDWENCLEKAKAFFEEIEDYETCQKCKILINKISKS